MRFSHGQSVLRALACLCALLLALPQPAGAYSVLSHEQVVDLAWIPQIVPLLQARYPGLTPEQLKEAHAYAYGGAIIQDIGYYPFGNKVLSDMLHYVRSGDFVTNLLKEASNPDEYAFALGALAHYCSDTYGHPVINRATPREFPKLRDRFGPVVTYDDDPQAHIRTEFGFDVLEVAQRRYAPENYHDFIGFQVAKPVFERAFRDTYGLPLDSVLKHEDLAIGSYRRTISKLLPQMTKVALADYKKQMQQTDPGYVPRHLLYRLSRADYERDWGKNYERPSFGERTLALFIRILPKIGPLRDLSLKVPDPDTQKLFLTGLDTVVTKYGEELAQLREQRPNRPPALTLINLDLDTGNPTRPGEYKLADQTYAKYLNLLVSDPKQPVPDAARADVLAFYAGRPIPAMAEGIQEQQAIVSDLAKLHATDAGPAAPAPPSSPPQPNPAHK